MNGTSYTLYDFAGFPWGGYGWLAFCGVRERAANICLRKNKSTYTIEDFFEKYPQFWKKDDTTDPPTYEPWIPIPIMQEVIDVANTLVSECMWGDSWKFAMGLVVAHFLWLIQQSYSDGSDNPWDIVDGGAASSITRQETLGDATIAFDNNLSLSGIEGYGSWTESAYGRQYITLARLFGIGGAYFI